MSDATSLIKKKKSRRDVQSRRAKACLGEPSRRQNTSAKADALGTLRLLEAMRIFGFGSTRDHSPRALLFAVSDVADSSLGCVAKLTVVCRPQMKCCGCASSWGRRKKIGESPLNAPR